MLKNFYLFFNYLQFNFQFISIAFVPSLLFTFAVISFQVLLLQKQKLGEAIHKTNVHYGDRQSACERASCGGEWHKEYKKRERERDSQQKVPEQVGHVECKEVCPTGQCGCVWVLVCVLYTHTLNMGTLTHTHTCNVAMCRLICVDVTERRETRQLPF